MEFGGLVVAAVTAVVMAYAVPASVARRKAVVASREGDRFSPGVDLVCPQPQVIDPEMQRQSTQPLLPTALAVSSEGTIMSDAAVSRRVAPSTSGVSGTRTAHRSPTQQMTALRARRAARLSREAAAVKQRIAAAIAGSALMLIFAVAAGLGALSWAWMTVPGVILAATVASSMWGSWKAQKDNAVEIAELKRIKESLVVSRAQRDQKTAASRARVRDNRDASLRAVAEQKSGAQGQAEETYAVAQTVVESKSPRHSVQEDEVVAVVDTATREEQTEAGSSDSDAAASEATSEIREEQGEAVSDPVRSIGAESLNADSKAPQTSREWSVTSLPPVRGKSAGQALRRRVHADTDLVPTVGRRSAGVPARPIRKSQAVAAATETAAQLTGPTFRFDLDAVLDQRRAQ